MNKLFIETTQFTSSLRDFLDDPTYAQFQQDLMQNPSMGNVIPGCGGLRKIRIRDSKRQKGKRGGARVIYLHVPEVNWILMLDIYLKGEKEDLNAAEKKILKNLAEQFKRDAIKKAIKNQSKDE